MSDTFNNYVQWAWKRKSELTKIIFERTQGEVIQGPFKGMKILPKWAWGDGDTAGKLLGLYECELFEHVKDAVSKSPDVVINVGCAEGFYGIGRDCCSRPVASSGHRSGSRGHPFSAR